MKFNCGSLDSFKEKEIHVVNVEDSEICLVRINGAFKAFVNRCPHQGIPLEDGIIKDNWIVCTMHGWLFDMDSGDCGVNPMCKLKTFKTEVIENQVFIIK